MEWQISIDRDRTITHFSLSYNLHSVRLWEHTHPLKSSTISTEVADPCLTYDEENAIWYVAGRKIRKELIPKRDSYVTIIESFSEEEWNNEEMDDNIDWLGMVNAPTIHN